MVFKAPVLRFRDEDGKEFPGWVERRLGDVAEQVKRKAPSDSQAPVMMISADSGFIYQKDRYSRENAGESLKNYTLLKEGELAYNHGYSKIRNYGSVFMLQNEEARVPFVYHSFRINYGIAGFWARYLNSGLFDKVLRKLISSSVRMDGLLNISYDSYMNMIVRVPTLAEQRKIADFLTAYDVLIDTQEKRLEALKLRKKGLLQKIFSQQIRFRDDEGREFLEWEEKCFGDIVNRKSKTSFSSSSIPGIEYEDIISGSGRLNKDVSLKESSKKGILFTVGDVLYGKLRPYLRNWFLPNFTGVAIGDFWVLISKEIIPGFLYYLLQSSGFDKIANTSIGTKMPRADWKLISMYVVRVPTLAEQRKIADFLTVADHQIVLEEKRLETMRLIKKGLLQKMFV